MMTSGTGKFFAIYSFYSIIADPFVQCPLTKISNYRITTVVPTQGLISNCILGVHYKSSLDCGIQVIKAEGFMSLMKGAGANILRGVAGAGVLSGADEVKAFYIKMRG